MRFHQDRGFTLVELMTVILITMIGFMAILMLQAGVIKGNSATWDVAAATNLGQHFLESVRVEALEWTDKDLSQGYSQNKFQYLNKLAAAGVPVAGGTTGWLRAFDLGANAKFQMVNQVGRDAAYDAGVLIEVPNTRNQRFCLQYRLTWIVPDSLVRAEVRVMWPRSATNASNYDACPPGMEQQVNDVYGVTLATAVMKNAAVL